MLTVTVTVVCRFAVTAHVAPSACPPPYPTVYRRRHSDAPAAKFSPGAATGYAMNYSRLLGLPVIDVGYLIYCGRSSQTGVFCRRRGEYRIMIFEVLISGRATKMQFNYNMMCRVASVEVP